MGETKNVIGLKSNRNDHDGSLFETETSDIVSIFDKFDFCSVTSLSKCCQNSVLPQVIPSRIIDGGMHIGMNSKRSGEIERRRM